MRDLFHTNSFTAHFDRNCHTPLGSYTYELLTRPSLLLKSTIFWDITPCSPLKVSRRFERTSPPFSGSNKPSKISAWKKVTMRWYLARFIRPWRWRRYVPPKRGLSFNGQHGVIYRMTVRTSNPTQDDFFNFHRLLGSLLQNVQIKVLQLKRDHGPYFCVINWELWWNPAQCSCRIGLVLPMFWILSPNTNWHRNLINSFGIENTLTARHDFTIMRAHFTLLTT
jgi:hypothetical protein